MVNGNFFQLPVLVTSEMITIQIVHMKVKIMYYYNKQATGCCHADELDTHILQNRLHSSQHSF